MIQRLHILQAFTKERQGPGRGQGRLGENNSHKGPDGKRTWDSGNGDGAGMAGGRVSYGQGAGNMGNGEAIPLWVAF